MKRPVVFAALMLAVTGGAAVLRLAQLDNRPMHCDEANQAIKFRGLLEENRYVYDPREYHGPSLVYFTLPVARARSASTLAELTETHLRLVPALFGVALVGMAWLVRDELGRAGALCAAVLAAVSPAMVFHSRYYIQEMLLVACMLLAMIALWRLARAVDQRSEDFGSSPRWWLRPVVWSGVLGLAIAMMHASKETCVIPLSAMAVAAAVTLPNRRWFGRRPLILLVLSTATAAIVAMAVSALFFSSFGTNPDGVLDSYTTYLHYLGQASGEGSTGRHVQPWHYYFRVLFWWRQPGGPLWTEGAVAVLALVGTVAAVLNRGLGPATLPFARFLVVYTLLVAAAYSIIPYKTPWCAIGFLHGAILLAGVGAAVFVRIVPGRLGKCAAVALLVVAVGHLGWQAHRASFAACADPANPYVYAHTSADFPRFVERIERIAAAHGRGKAIHVQVICPDHDYWPLPWYLRDFPHVGYHDKPPRGLAAPLILTQPAGEASVVKYLGEDLPAGERYLVLSEQQAEQTLLPYLGEELPPSEQGYYVFLPTDGTGRPWRLRPHVFLAIYVRADLWLALRAP